MIRAVSLTKKFKDITAVNGLTFNVNRGEIFGIVGPDGAGKSTLLRMMAGISDPTEGELFINGLSPAREPYAVKENLAYMPQRFGLYEDLTVEENIFFFGRLFGETVKSIKERLPELYGFSRLGPFKDRPAGKLSGGMKQKLGLACCLVHRPRLILLDEPTNGVDPVSRREFWKILYGLLADGVTIVVSTAYLDEAERCGRVALISEGGFLTIGPPSEIKKSIGRDLLVIEADDPWKAEEIIRSSKKFSTAIREGASIRIFTGNIAAAKKEIAVMLKKKGISFTASKRDPSLENCFVEIVSGGRHDHHE
jgi:ABC-2 type transport system ATP-binding protein